MLWVVIALSFAIGFLLTAISIAAIGQVTGNPPLLVLAVLVAGTLMNTAQSSLPALAATVDGAVQPGQHQAHGLAVGGVDQLDGVGGQARFGQGLGDDPGDGQGRLQAVRTAAQDGGVARTDAQGGGVGGDVGAALVNHAQHADWGADAGDVQDVVVMLHDFSFRSPEEILAELGDVRGRFQTNDQLAAEAHAISTNSGTPEGIEGVDAFVDKRTPDYAAARNR